MIINMQKKTIKELNQKWDLELDKIVKTVKKGKVRRVLLQFPDGLKPYSLTIKKYLENKTGKKFFIWLGSCFGACDVPNVNEKDFDLIVQFGHSKWDYKDEDIDVLD
jgi:2-(3-amino-3-carboxypropyl)histidine synthase